MSVENANVIDAIGVENSTGKVVLTISDHLDWSDVHGHLVLLQDKINSYIRFVESGEIEASYPAATGKERVIDLVTKYQISVEANSFLTAASETLSGIGIEFRQKTLGA